MDAHKSINYGVIIYIIRHAKSCQLSSTNRQQGLASLAAATSVAAGLGKQNVFSIRRLARFSLKERKFEILQRRSTMVCNCTGNPSSQLASQLLLASTEYVVFLIWDACIGRSNIVFFFSRMDGKNFVAIFIRRRNEVTVVMQCTDCTMLRR